MPDLQVSPELPRIVYDDVPPEDQGRLQAIDTQFHEEPGMFLMALMASGSLVTDRTRTAKENSEDDATLLSLSKRPADLILEYFRRGFDRAGFDDDTETAIAADPHHHDLLIRHNKATSQRARTGEMQSFMHAHPQAEDIRDEIRRSRLGLYLSQIIAHQRQVAAQLGDSRSPDTWPKLA